MVVREFVVIYFESSEQWCLIAPSGACMVRATSAGDAVSEYMERFGLVEANYDVEDLDGTFYRYSLASEGPYRPNYDEYDGDHKDRRMK